MASTTTSKQNELTLLMVELARTELAAVSALVKFWRGWVDSAEKFTGALSSELTKAADGGRKPAQFVGGLTDSTREYLRNVAELPKLAINQFTSELEKIGKQARRTPSKRPRPAAKRTRAARAKA